MMRLVITLLLALGAATSVDAAARPDFTPVIGSQLDLDLRLTDESGASASLATYTTDKPALILFGYHRCPNLCGVAQLDLGEALKKTGLVAGSFSVLFLSVDPQETSSDAAADRAKLHAADAGLDLTSWHFLVADAPTLATLEQAVGLTVTKTSHDLYVHPVAVSALTPDGRLSAVLSGLDYPSSELRQAIVVASAGKLGTLGEHILLLCSAILGIGRYTGAAFLAMRILAVCTMLALGGVVVIAARRRRA
jgi:protein SCO1/2